MKAPKAAIRATGSVDVYSAAPPENALYATG